MGKDLKILVTGSNGLLGQKLTDLILRENGAGQEKVISI